MISYSLINPKETAILVIDIQNAYCSPKGKIAKLGHDIFHIAPIISKMDALIGFARKKKITVIFTRFIEDPDYMKRNAQIKMKLIPNSKIVSPNTYDFEYYKIRPEKSDYQIIKKSYDAFSNPRLDKILKAKKIKNIIIMGAYSDMCVDMTLRSAYTKGYNVIVPQDLVSTTKVRLKNEKIIIKLWSEFFANITYSKEILRLWVGK